MNKYGSILRTYTIRNLYEATLTTGNDIVIPAGVAPYRNAPQFTMDISKESNFFIDKCGVFSNFADGLVFKNPADRIDVGIGVSAYVRSSNLFTLNFTYGSVALTTAIGNPNWTPGNTYYVAVTESVSGRVMIVTVVATGANTGNLEDYWQYTTEPLNCESTSIIAVPGNFTLKEISTLNCMYNVNEYFQPLLFASGNTYDYVALQVLLNHWAPHTTTLMTNTIDSAYDDEKVYFDVVLDVEFTSK